MCGEERRQFHPSLTFRVLKTHKINNPLVSGFTGNRGLALSG